MARFSGDPVKNPLFGNEFIPCTDPLDGNDKSFTPIIITQFVASNMALANGSTNGLIDPTSYAKLLALDTQAQTNIRINQLAEVAIPVFFGAPSNGAFSIYQHCLDIPWVLALQNLMCSAGSTNVTITKNGVSIGGLTSNPCTSVAAQFAVSGGSTNYTFNNGDILGITFAGTTGNCVNFAASIKANATISP